MEVNFHEKVLFLLAAWVIVGDGYLLNGHPCIASSPCTCWGHSVSCVGKDLTSVPTFIPTTSKEYAGSFGVNLQDNQISTIHDHAFQNISSIQTPLLHLYLSNNTITRIDDHAFDGIENNTNKIALDNNKLTSIPAAFGKLKNLKSLDLQFNPIKTLDSSVMSHLGRSLTTLYIHMESFQSWPMSLNLLSQLKSLYAFYIPFNHLPYNAFDGMSSTLTYLRIVRSKLYRIPSAVCHLRELETLYFNDNYFLETKFSIFEPCNHQLEKLTLLSLRDNNLINFPHVLFHFPSLIHLYLHNNSISYVPSSAIPYNSSLTDLNIQRNDLTRVPNAFNKLNELQTLNLQYNKITSIQDNDFTDLPHLLYIYFTENPIVYVSPNAFKSLGNLTTLELSGTLLTSIPEAVMYAPELKYLVITSTDIKCSCALSYLNGWNMTSVHIYGFCNKQNNDPLKQYIETSLPNCP